MPSVEETRRERRRAHRLARKLIRFLRDEFTWTVRFMDLEKERVRKSIGFTRRIVGATLWDRELIAIDPTFDDFFAVLIHECLHAVFPDMSEADVRGLERLLRKHLTPAQASDLIAYTARRLPRP